MTIDFTYYHFEPLLMDEAMSAISGPHSEGFKRDVYHAWLDEFICRAHSVNVSQYHQHADRVYAAFCREYGIERGWNLCDLAIEYTREFDGYSDAMGLGEHREAMEWNTEVIRSYHGSDVPTGPVVVTSTDALERLLDKLDNGTLYPEDVCGELWGVWFDKVTAVEPEQQPELRKMPYRDYLQTPYWKRIRIAMMIAHRLRCQGEECQGLDSWYGGEWDLNVHHLHYRNRGRETFGNLRLLCADCHTRVHAGDVSVLPLPSMEYVNYMDDCDWNAIRQARKARHMWTDEHFPAIDLSTAAPAFADGGGHE